MSWFLLSLLALSPVREAGGAARIEAAIAKSAVDGKPVLVDFHTSWCVPCQKFLADYRRPAFKKELADRVHLVKVDSDADNELAEFYKSTHLPTWLLLNPDKQVLGRFRGYNGKEKLLRKLDWVLADAVTIPNREDRFQRSPHFRDAWVLGTYYDTGKDPLQAMIWYLEAERLKPEGFPSFRPRMVELKVWLFENEPGSVLFSELMTEAGVLWESEVMGYSRSYALAVRLMKLARLHGSGDDVIHTLSQAVTFGRKYEGNTYVARHVKQFQAELLQRRDEDGAAAAALYEETLPEKWREDEVAFSSYVCWRAQAGVASRETFAMTQEALAMPLDDLQRADVLAARSGLAWEMGHRKEAADLMGRAIDHNPNRMDWHETAARYKAEMTP